MSKKKGIIHLHAEDESLSGESLTLNGRKVLHFGTCGYLGLEHHAAVKRGAIDAIERYGTQFPMSRTYVSNPLYSELEVLIREMYNAPVVISKNCTLAHQTTIPGIIRQTDLVILDHQAHASIQEAVKKLLGQGIAVEMIRHNNLEMLEDRIKKQRNKYERIWYMADGVYSMYGDYAPIKEVIALAEKYEQLYLYVDDAHGMSWAGKHGTGYVMSQMEDGLYRKMVLTANLGKAFGACGGLSLFPNEEWYNKVNTFGGPLTFSVQIEPATLGAALASARIHLSNEIYTYQEELQKRIAYCNTLLKSTNLPLVHENNSPIFFIGTGTMDMGNYLVQQLLQDGVYVNLATFPAVPAKNIGIRITISLNNSFEDIERMVQKLNYNFRKALLVTDQTDAKIRKAFKLPENSTDAKLTDPRNKEASLCLKSYTSVKSISETTWNSHLGKNGMFDWRGMQFLERSFSDNAELENNWNFRYYVVEDNHGKLILITCAVIALYKEDMFSQVSVSRIIEKERVLNPYYLTAKGIFLGTLFTEGDHLYLNRDNDNWKPALKLLLNELSELQEKEVVSNIMLRDFDAADQELQEIMIEQGYAKVDLPDSCTIEGLNSQTEAEYVQSLSQKNRRHYVQKIKRNQHHFNVEVKGSLTAEELDYAVKLFRNVKSNNLAINNFLFPFKLFKELNEDPAWEFIMLYLKEDYAADSLPVAVCFCHQNAAKVYSPMLIGMNYDYLIEYGVYRQALFRVINRASALGCATINFGISASVEKKRIGANLKPKVGYYQAKDNFAMELIETTFLIERE
ncbi:7-keto-8-aminopelargonate synthetase-like enzyme [Pontibacter aydingkolensis]|uniref:GNAT family N-acetyltransferase n=1 Tax=Pontibacter aydingkolensis TaxID=1911536 RepID=A0ABS7CW38_9BACT|nr:bifunctional aminotransferase class I/II-fold pyridoxal phosphate-dependent enzyme/GNAT family N-acetyltransferase [Pontibacter aydingkolensis]MBW7468074.1 GNAT family N-acetyltransferase [Pontibacter aydingkolensis]